MNSFRACDVPDKTQVPVKGEDRGSIHAAVTERVGSLFIMEHTTRTGREESSERRTRGVRVRSTKQCWVKREVYSEGRCRLTGIGQLGRIIIISRFLLGTLI